MSIDVYCEILIRAPRSNVAAYAMNPDHDPDWIGGIREARMATPPPLRLGSRVERVARFLGRRFHYVLEIAELRPATLLGMHSVSGPFPMQVTYSFADANGGTRMGIRVEGDAGGFFRLAAPLLALMVKRNVSRDLRSLKGRMERSATAA
jgi:hypothetical protein